MITDIVNETINKNSKRDRLPAMDLSHILREGSGIRETIQNMLNYENRK